MVHSLAIVLICLADASCFGQMAPAFSSTSGQQQPFQTMVPQESWQGYIVPLDDPRHVPDGFTQTPSPLSDVVIFDTPFMSEQLDFQNSQTDKQLLLLSHGANQSGTQLILGTQLRGSFLAAATNRESKFPYLGRFPTDFTGRNATDARLLQGNLAVAGHFGNWAHGYFETLFSDVFSFDSFEQGSFQVRQAYLTLGDLNVSPFYMFLGKKNVGFGNMGTLSPFTQAVPWHYFAALHEGIGAGFYQDGVNFNVTALNGGRGIRVADSESKGRLNNFAANLTVARQVSANTVVQLGGGYLHGTIYDGSVAEHLDPTVTGDRNGAWDANAQIRYRNYHLAAEFIRTLQPWPTTGSNVTAYRAEGGMDFFLRGRPATATVSWSEGIQGPSGSQFEFNRQLVLGSSLQLSPNALVTLEYVHSSGFAPLLAITRVSDRSVHQHSAVLGIVLSL